MTYFSKYPFLAKLDLDNSTLSKLSLRLDRTIIGSDDVLVTPLALRIKPEEILKEFDLIFNSRDNLSLLNESLLDLERSNRKSYGPRSIILPWAERLESYDNMFGQGVEYQSPTITPFSKDKHCLRPISLGNAAKFLKNSTSSGLPYLDKKGNVKDRAVADINVLLGRNYPCCLLTRSQESKKNRIVWEYPIGMTLFETRYYRPLLDYQKKLGWRSALLAPGMVDKSVTELINDSMIRHASLLSIDFSQFDATVKRNLQKKAFEYIKYLYPEEYHKDIDFISDYFNNCGLVTPSGISIKPHGVPSGSTFTNEVDSIVQFQTLISSKNIFKENVQIQGDDGVCAINPELTNQIFNWLEVNGLKVNRDKSYVSNKKCYYLRKLYDNDYRLSNGIIGGIYPVYRALSRLVYQERWIDFEDYGLLGKDYYSLRAIGILENCKHNPLFEPLVKFILSIDKYRLNYSRDGLSKYVSMLEQTKGAGDILFNQYGNDIKGIENFETVKLIKRMR